jgi:transketolase
MRPKGINKSFVRQAEEAARRIRRDMLTLAHKSKTPHIGPALSCVDILTVLYTGIMKTNCRSPLMANRDRFILSKGHGALALYTCLSHMGFLSKQVLFSYCENGSPLAEHPLEHKFPCIEFAAGSLGHGLAVGIGLAMASRLKNEYYKVFVLMGDGECNEGSVWEAAGFASTMKLNNLIVIVDHNKLQATDRYEKLSGGYDLTQVWKSFGWETREVDGHDIMQMRKVYTGTFFKIRKPKVIIAHTVKGKGVSFMENNLEWHYRWPDAQDLQTALEELK